MIFLQCGKRLVRTTELRIDSYKTVTYPTGNNRPPGQEQRVEGHRQRIIREEKELVNE